jgi:hypothetical protein
MCEEGRYFPGSRVLDWFESRLQTLGVTRGDSETVSERSLLELPVQGVVDKKEEGFKVSQAGLSLSVSL